MTIHCENMVMNAKSTKLEELGSLSNSQEQELRVDLLELM